MGFRSGFEATLAQQIKKYTGGLSYEKHKLDYVEARTYTPDFYLERTGIFVEAKGQLDALDRRKLLLILEQYPDIDLRMVFMRDLPIRKGSKVKYSDWCKKHGIKYAFGKIPEDWF